MLVGADLTVAFGLTSDKDLRDSILSLLTPLVALIAESAALLTFQETRRQNDRTFATTQRQLDEARKQNDRTFASYLAGRLAETYSPHFPFLFGAAAVLVALVVLFSGHRYLNQVDAPDTAGEHDEVIIEELEAGAGVVPLNPNLPRSSEPT